jgi:hypothetical protein
MAPNQLKLFRVFFKGEDHFFQSKQAAKEFGREHGLKGAVVHRGPDHWRGQSDGTSVQTKSSKRGW